MMHALHPAHRASWIRQVMTSPGLPMAPIATPSIVRLTAPALPARTMMAPVAFRTTTLGGLTMRPDTLDSGVLSWRSSRYDGLPATWRVPTSPAGVRTTIRRVAGAAEPLALRVRSQVPGESGMATTKLPSLPALVLDSTRFPADGARTGTVL